MVGTTISRYKSPRKSGKVAWERSIEPRTPSSTVMSLSRYCRKPLPRTKNWFEELKRLVPME